MRIHHLLQTLLKVFVTLSLLFATVVLALPTSPAMGRSIADSTIVTWTGRGGDAHWSNPANWDVRRVPTVQDAVRFTTASPDATIDAAFTNDIASLEIQAGYRGTLNLGRSLHITGDLVMNGGTLDSGLAAAFWVSGAVQVTGGLFITPRATLRVTSMDIQAPGVVRLGLNGRLNLDGAGSPLTGNGLLDITTNRPNTVEYTGHPTTGLSNAGPLASLRALKLSKSNIQQSLATAPNAPLLTSNFITTTGSFLAAAVIDTANGFAYFGSNANPAVIVKVNLATFSEVGAVSLLSDGAFTSGVLDTTRGFAYFGGLDSTFTMGSIIKVNVSPSGFAYSNTLSLGGVGTSLTSAVIDPANGLAYFGGLLNGAQGGIFKIGLTTPVPTLIDTLALPVGEDWPTSAVIDTINHAAYFGVTDFGSSIGNVVKIALSPVFTRTTATPLAGTTNLYSAVIDQAAGLAYFGAASFDGVSTVPPVKIVKVQLSPISTTAPISVATISPFSTITWPLDQVKAAVIDTAGGFAYFAGSDSLAGSPTVVAKVQLSNFTPVEWLSLVTVGENAISAVIDPVRHNVYLGMESTLVAQIVLANSQIAVTSSANPSVWGQSVTFTATVSALPGNPGRPTGTVTFTLDSGTGVTRTLIAAGTATSTATLVTTTLSVGSHTILVSYSGDATFTPASGSINQTVNQANTSVGIVPSTNPSVYGQPITFTATVTATAPGAGTPTGAVTFTFDGGASVAATLNASRQATYVTSTLAVAAHSITAAYGGNGNFNTGASSPFTQTVNKASSATSITSSPNPTVFGQSATFTATVAAVAPGAGVPTGIVTFTIDGTPVAVASSGGVATYITSTLAVGSRSVSATYGGDPSFSGSASGALNQVVNKASTTTSVTSAPNASVFGQSVTFTATVTVVAPGAGNPSGTMTFLDNGLSIGTGGVNAGGLATLTISSLTAVTHANITAQYGGDASFNGSTSSAYLHTVNKAGTAITLTTSAPSPSFYLQTVTFTFTLGANAPGAGTPTGVVTITDGTQLCAATLPATGCTIAFNSVGAKSLTAAYSGDGSFNSATSGAFAHTVAVRPPVANDDSYTMLENGVLTVAATGVLSNDLALNGRPITSTLLNGPITGTLVFNPNGSFVFTSTQFFNGVVTYTYQANDAALVSNAATVTMTVLPVNQPPSFTPGPDISVFTSTQFITNSWAANISPGPANESGQTVTFTVTTNNPNLFQIPPALSPTGTLSFKPAPFYAGTAIATVFAQDNGGTANGGVDTSPSITFTIVISSDPDVPVNNVPGPQSTYINVPRVFSSATGNAISVTDPDAALLSEGLSVTLRATNGTLRLGSLAGLIVTPTNGGGSMVSLSGLITPTNAALNGLTFTPTLDFVGAASLVIETQDLGHFGEPASFVVADPINIAVLDSPIVSLTAVNSSPTALGLATLFTATQTGGTHVTYVWNFGDGLTTTGQLASHSYGAVGTYTAIVTATNPTNQLTATTPVTIVDAAIISVVASNSSPTVFGSSTQFTATQTGGTNVTYTWSFGDGATTTGQFPAHTYAAASGYTAIVTASNSVSSKSTTSAVTVNKATPVVVVTGHAVDPAVVGESVAITFTVTPPGAGTPTGAITVTDGTLTCLASVAVGQCAIAFTSPGVKTLTAQYSGDANFTSAASGSVTHTVNKADTTTSITSIAPTPALFGQSTAITVSVSPVAPGAGTPGGTITVTDGTVSCIATLPGTSCSLTFNVLGSHTLTATYSGNASFSTSRGTSAVTVNDVAITTVTATTSSPTRLDDTTLFTATTNGTNAVYAWNFGDGSPIGSGGNVTHTYALSGTYTANVTATNSLSTQSTTTAVTITNQRPVAVALDTAFSLSALATLDGSRSVDPDNHLPLTYFWTQTGGGAVSFTPNLSVTTFPAPSSPTVLTFTLTVTDAHGLPSLPKTVSITVADIPITGLVASNSSPTAIGVPTQFTATITAGSSVVYIWNFGDGITTTTAAQNVAHTYGTRGNYTALVTATNQLTPTSTSTAVTIIKATPVAVITSHTLNPSVVGESVTINFSLTPPGVGTPTGGVTVTAGTQSCTAALPAASCNIAFTSAGSKTLTAQYSGDANFNAAASASVNHIVNPADTTTSVASSANPSVFGQSVIFTATVVVAAPGAGTPTGTVAFTIDGVQAGTSTVSGGVATYITSMLAAATHPVVAAYSGDANFNGNTSGPLNQVVNQASTSTGVASLANPSVFGQSVTFTATVTASGPGAGTPSGTLMFTIDGAPAGTATLSGGVATYVTSTLSVGSHTVSVAYVGDPNFTGSTGLLASNHTVNKANSTTTIASSLNPSIISQTVTFTATVTASAPGAGNPSGVVTFTIDGNTVATITLSAGTATYNTAALAVGSHPVSVTYGGDGNFNTSTGGQPQVVNRPPSATNVTSAPNPSVFGQSVTFTATVTPVSDGPTPTGLVTFTFDGVVTGSTALSGGVASFSSAALTAGAHPVVVIYGGDVNFDGSASSTYTQTVNKANTTTSVTSAPNPAVFGQSVTFTATVTVSAPGAGNPSGTVTFFDGATSLGTGTVNASGIATLAISTLDVGAHNAVTAQYGSDANFNGSTSGSYLHTVNPANTTTGLASTSNPSVFGQSITFTATVGPVLPGTGTPAGVVTFTIGGAPVSTVSLNGGVAAYVTSTLAVGAHAVTAVYGGDGHFNGSAASPINQSVNKANTTATVISSLNPSPVTRLITFTATIAAAAPGVGVPTGIVTFTIDGGVVGTPALSGGVAIYSTSVLTVGSHTVAVTYGSDTNFNGSVGALTPNQLVSQYRTYLPIIRR